MKCVFFVLFLIGPIFADKIYLKTGAVVEGDIIGKSEVILKIFVEAFHRSVAIEKEAVDYIETTEGKQFSFEEFQLKKKEDFNPQFRVPPRIIRPVEPAAVRKKLFDRDVFELSARQNTDSILKATRRLNLFFNAPLRFGSIGMGYAYFTGLQIPKKRLENFGFRYDGSSFDLRCLDVQIRKNLNSGLGTVILDLGYGKKSFMQEGDSILYEFASTRFVSLRYSLCKNRWLFSPGLSAGVLLSKEGVTHQEQKADSVGPIIDVAPDDHLIRPIVGMDFNFYDVITAHIDLDLWRAGRGRYYMGLICLMPFLQ